MSGSNTFLLALAAGAAGLFVVGSALQGGSDRGGSGSQPLSGPLANAAELIKGFESFSAKAYPDPPGQTSKYSIGWGHQIRIGDPYDKDSVISQSEGDALLVQDIQGAYNCVVSRVRVDLNDNQLKALVSFCYNIGCGAFSSSSLLRYLNNGDYVSASKQFPVWIYANGQVNDDLVSRREQEQEVFNA